MKRAEVEPGSIKVCGQQKHHSYPKEVDGWINIPAWSRGAGAWKELSPFFIASPDNPKGNFESYWQSWKVWESVNGEKHVDPATGNPNEAWKVWHDALANNPKPVRRPNGYVKPLYAWWEGERLDVVQARKRIYIPGLQKMYRAHPQYQKLLELVRNGQSVIIIEPDGPPLSMYPSGMDVNLDLLIQLQDVTTAKDFPVDNEVRRYTTHDNKYIAYGHGYCIALTLLQDLRQ